jgi:signal transduction histidine kinase
MTVPNRSGAARYTIPLIFGSVVAAVVLVASAALYNEYQRYRASIASAESTTSALSELIEGGVQRMSASVDRTLDAAARLVADDPGTRDYTAFSLNLDAVPVRALVVTDADAQPVLAPRVGTASRLLQPRDHLAAHAGKPGQSHVGTPVRDSDGRWLISVSRAARDGAGRIRSIAIAMVELDPFASLVAPIGQLGYSASLIHPDGTLLARVPHRDDLVGVSLAGSRLMRDLAPRNPAGFDLEMQQADDAERVIAYRLASPWRMVVSVGFDKGIAFAALRRQLVEWGIVVALLAALALLSITGQVRENRRLRVHARAMEEMAADLRRAATMAEDANRAKSEFLAKMSHELRTPLNAVLGFSEMMDRQVFGPLGAARYTEYVRDIHNSASHLLGLIGDLLDLAKIETGRFTLHEEAVDLAALLDACAHMVRDDAVRRRLAFRVELPQSGIHLRADEMRLRQIVVNLLSNALKFTPTGGEITLAAEVAADGPVSIKVSDTGIGMSGEQVRNVVKFGAVPNAQRVRAGEGSGLGLAIARSLAEQHGGSLNIESFPGRGTTVTVLLPRERVALASAA